jgi:hypothetical protein
MAHPVYKVGGKRVPSVTTILSRYKESGGLMYWANQVGLGEHDSCSDQVACKHCGKRPGKTLNEARSGAADVGSLAHDLIHYEVTGEEPELSLVKKYEHLSEAQWDLASQCHESYQEWQEVHKVKYVGHELSLLSHKHRYGGTLDAIGYVNDRFSIIDYKTSAGWYADYFVQLAGYILLVEEDPQLLMEYGAVQRICGLRMSKETAGFDTFVRPRETFDVALRYFLHLREAYEMDKQVKKLMK